MPRSKAIVIASALLVLLCGMAAERAEAQQPPPVLPTPIPVLSAAVSPSPTVTSTVVRSTTPAASRTPVTTQSTPTPAPQAVAPLRQRGQRDARHAKVESALLRLARTAADNPSQLAEALGAAGVPAPGNRVQVVLEVAPGSAAGAKSQAGQLGGRLEAEFGDLVQVELPLAVVEQLANHPDVRLVRLPYRPELYAVTSEGVSWTGANAWVSADQTGTGARVAVLDLGFAGYATRQAEGDLPSGAIVRSFRADGDIAAGIAHGTGVAEVVYDMAPGAQLYLVNFYTEVELGNAVNWLISEGVHVLNLSAGYAVIAGRGDGSGFVANIVNRATAAGILWVNAAGNSAQRHWGGAFRDSDGNGRHEWSGSGESNGATFSAGQTGCVYLRWDAWPTTNQDFDLYLVNSLGQTVAQSTNAQSGTQRPTESLCYTSPTTASYFVVVDQYSASTNPRLDLEVTNTSALQHVVASGSISIPADTANAFTVGAIDYGSLTSAVESFSSQGPTVDGRIKPDIAGPDRITTGTYGSNGAAGTSFSAPHVAGAAALVKGANASYTPSQLRVLLNCRAQDLGLPGTDNVYGVGRLALGDVPSAAVTAAIAGQVSLLAQPARVVDTRPSSGYQGAGQPLAGYECPRRYTIAGRGGVPADAVGIVANVTTSDHVGGAHLTIWPAGQPQPATSNVNYVPVEPAIANMAIVRLGAGGAVDVVASTGTNFFIDVVGYVVGASNGQTALLAQPARVVDTRPGSRYQGAGQPLQGYSSAQRYTIGGQGGVPADAVGIVANVTSTDHRDVAHLTIWPAGQPQPATSNLNYAPVEPAIANMAIVRLGAGGAVDVVGSTGTNFFIDIVGYIVDSAGPISLLSQPARVVDARPLSGYQGAGQPLQGYSSAQRYTIAGQGGVPADAVGIVANVTSADHRDVAHLTIWPAGQPQPATSNLNYAPVEPAIANMAIVRLGAGGAVDVVGSTGTNFFIDIVGYIR